MADGPKIRQCTICASRDAGEAPRRNPRLCAGCQDWDDILHVSFCRERAEAHPPMNPVAFSYKHNPDWPPARKGGYGALADLKYLSAEELAARLASSSDGGGEACIMCAALADALRRAEKENEREGEDGGKGEKKKTKIAVWRPFILDQAKNQWNIRDEEAAAQKGIPLPWLQKCVLAICIATAPGGEGNGKEGEEKDAWEYKPGILELRLRYERWCWDLSAVEPWGRRAMDTGQVKRWLRRCAHEHGEACASSWTPATVALPRGFRLIDVLERRVVRPEARAGVDIEYAALSYVWSAASASPEKQRLQLYSENIGALEKPGALSDEILPEVVADAIHLCVDVGQRYLWVDRFCIVQDDLQLKAEQIDAMGVIYDRAFLTIVCLGDGPVPGLLGIPCRPREPSFQNRSWDLLATMSNPVGEARLPLIDLAISESTWNNRAWTFQERALSKRRIYFDAGQVYGDCVQERWQERPVDEDEAEWIRTGSWEMHNLKDRPWDFGLDSFTTYSKVINHFSPRKLTYPDDVLRAFAGVVNVLETKLKRPMLLGHPEEFFTESLRWVPQPGFMATRRLLSNVPSWSWASWDSRATWDINWTMAPGIYLAVMISTVKASFVNFYFSDPKDGLRPVRERHQSLEHYLVEQKRHALKTIKEVTPSWWPASVTDDPATAEVSVLEDLVKQVWDSARLKAQNDDPTRRWPPSISGIPRRERLHDLSENDTAFAALRNLEEHTDTRWWPPTTTQDPETRRQLEDLSTEAITLAKANTNSLVFNTSCANLKVGPFGRMWFVIPPRRNLSGCAIQNRDGIPVGITMAMAPEMTFDMFQRGRECLVALLGVCSCKRWMQWDKGELSHLDPRHLNELCLFVMIMEEKEGVCKRLAVGVVYSDEWVKLQPQWRTLVLA